MLVELVRLSRVTLLFAETGSDKSGVVRSSVMPLLQEDGAGTVKEVAVLLDWWEKVPVAVLNARVDEALARIVGDAAHAMGDHASADSLCARLAARQQAFDCTFIIIFDRFEEYLAAPAERTDFRDFQAQFVEAVNSRTLRANFLLALEEDAAPLLARLRERIPGLGDARVRLPKVNAQHAAPAATHPAVWADRLVGSRAAVGHRGTPGAQISRPDAAASGALEDAGGEYAAIGDTIRALFSGAESQRQQYKRTASLAERLESRRAEYETHRALTAAGQRASSAVASAKRAPKRDQTTERQPSIGSAGEPVSAIAQISSEGHDPVASVPTALAARNHVVAARAAEAPPRSVSRRASIMIAIVVAVLSSLVVLGTRRGGEPASAPDAANAPGSTMPVQNEPKAGRDEGAQAVLPAGVGRETALSSEAVSATPKDNSGNPIDSAASPPPVASSMETLPRDQLGQSEASQASAVERPVASASPRAQARTSERRPPAVASELAAPLLYIHVGSEAQRAYAERMIEPLARHGIRVSGIKVVSVGPPVSDLRYFRSADRAEALRINRALDVVGTPAQRLKYIAGAEQAPQRQYELWLPPSP